MSGGSSDDATLSIAHECDGKAVVDLVIKQSGEPPFNPRAAVQKFCGTLKAYGLHRVTGDNYAGQTFKDDFQENGISYTPCRVAKTVLYEELEPRMNAGEVELPDIPKLQEQAIGLVVRGARIDHLPGEHDDWINAAAGAIWCTKDRAASPVMQVGRYELIR
jgi:hypothetical protein